MTFSERAKPLKDKGKITLSEIAAACNISESMASRYINGQNIPPEDIARKMLDLLSAAASEYRSESESAEAHVLRVAYEARLADKREIIDDLKAQVRSEKKEKWFFVACLVVAVCFVFLLLYIDITNGDVGWFRH